MASAEDVLHIATGELGYSRWDDPEAGTKYGRWYAGQVGDSYFGESGVPYCAMFVSWCLHQAGITEFTYAYCPYILRDYSGHLVYNEDARPGDIVLFNWDGGEVDHVGFVEVNCGSYFQTVEGNTNNGCVARRTRSFGVVGAVIRPPFYDGSSATQDSGGSGSSSDDDFWWWGPNTTRRCQEQRGTTVDGIISDQPSANREHVPAADSDSWDWVDNPGGGSELVTSIQRMTGAGVDGWFGPISARALQRWLTERGYDIGSCGVDGYFGSDSVRGLCAALDDGALRC